MCKVLIAEKEYLEREVLKDIIHKSPSASLIGETNNGIDALHMAKNLPCDLIFINLHLGGKTGLEVAGIIRNLNPDINIILTTGYLKEELIKETQNINIQKILLKPTPPAVINKIISSYASASKESRRHKVKKKDMKFYPGHMQSDNVAAVLSYIEKHYKENITLESVSNAIYLNPNYVSRLFKKEVGVTMSSYIIFKKLEEAKKMLEHTDKSIIDISAATGFTELSYFCKVFKKNVGFTPRDYRTKIRQSGAERRKIVEKYVRKNI